MPRPNHSIRPATSRPLLAVVGVLTAIACRPSSLAAQSPAASAVTSACHVSPIVANLDKAAHFYHDVIGFDLVPSPPPGPLPWDTRPEHLDLHGLPQARLRFIGARMPGVFCGVELVEFAGVSRQPVARRLQDPGTAMLILLVRDLDTVFARVKAAGVEVVTTGGTIMNVGAAKTRAVVVKDPDGHFVELAQLDPLPQTSAAVGSSVIGIRLRVTVDDSDRAAQYYRVVLGSEPRSGSFTKNDAVMAMMGLPSGAEYRLGTVQFPGASPPVELIEFKGLTSTRVVSRVQDPGSYRLQLNVRDLDATLRAVKAAGGQIVSSNGVPVSMTFGTSLWRLAVAPDLNNLFLILQQRTTETR